MSDVSPSDVKPLKMAVVVLFHPPTAIEVVPSDLYCASAVGELGGLFTAAGRNATIDPTYRLAALNVCTDATEEMVVWTRSCVVNSPAVFNVDVERCVNDVPAVIVLVVPALFSSEPNIRSP